MKTKLAVNLKVGETLTIGSTTIRLEKKSGQTARLVVCAEKQTAITTPNVARMSALQTTGADPHDNTLRQ